MARVRSGRLALAIFLVALVGVAAAAGLPALLAATGLVGRPADPADATLGRARAALTAIERQRLDRLSLAARLLAREGALIRVLGEAPGAAGEEVGADGAAALADLLAQRRSEVGFDLALVLDPEGRVRAVSDGAAVAVGADLGADPFVAGGLADGRTAGAWRGAGGITHVAIEPVAPDFDLLGYLLVGDRVDEVLALEIGRASGGGVTFLAATGDPWDVVASSLGAGEAAELAAALDLPEGGVAGSPDASVTREGTAQVAAGKRRVMLVPLTAGAGSVTGLALLSTAAAPAAGPLATFLPLAAGAGLALLLSLFLAPLVARRALAPAARLVEVVDSAPRESFARRLEPGRYRALAPLAAALDRLFRTLQEERSLAATAMAALRRRAAAGAADRTAGGEPEATEGAVVAFEMRREVDFGAGARPAVDRLTAAHAVLEGAVAAVGGRLVPGAGHTAFAAFDGEDAAWRALTAAAVGLDGLSAAGGPPGGDPAAAAVATGRSIRSGGAAGDGSGGTVGDASVDAPGPGLLIGPAVLLAESVLRESSPGEVAMTRAVHRAVAEALAAQGVEAAERRGLLSPQPVLVLAAAAVGTLAAASRPAAAPAAAGRPHPGGRFAGRHRVAARSGTSQGAELWRLRRAEGGAAALKWLPSPAAGVLDALRGLDAPLDPFRRFEHPAFAAIEEVGESGDGVYLVREWVDGVPLTALGELPPPAGLALSRQLAAALAALHREGLAHGRVKPENVIVEADGRARFVDQGVAVVVGPSPSASAGGRLLGPAPGTDARADVYALAVLVHRLVLGHWRGEEAGEGAAPPPPGLAELLARALAEEPAARPGDASEIATALEGITA